MKSLISLTLSAFLIIDFYVDVFFYLLPSPAMLASATFSVNIKGVLTWYWNGSVEKNEFVKLPWIDFSTHCQQSENNEKKNSSYANLGIGPHYSKKIIYSKLDGLNSKLATLTI